jgi:hypothetical protein
MPDAGDEAGEKAAREAKEFLKWLYQQKSGNGLNLFERTKDFFSEFKRSRKDGTSETSRHEPDTGYSVPEQEAASEVPYRTLYAENAEDAVFLSHELSKAGIEHCMNVEAIETEPLAAFNTAYGTEDFEGKDAIKRGESGCYEFYLPNRAPYLSAHAPLSDAEHALVASRAGYTLLKDVPEEMKGLMEWFGIDSTETRLSQNAACIQARDLIPEVSGPLSSTVLFKTVKWDRNALLLSDNLDNLGIPYKKTILNDREASFAIHPEHVQAVRELTDSLCNNVKGMNHSRVSIDGVQAVPLGEERPAYTRHFTNRTPLSEEAAHKAKAALDAENISYECYTDRETGETYITVDEAEVEGRGYKMLHAQTAVVAMPSIAESKGAVQEYIESEDAQRNADKVQHDRASKGLDRPDRTRRYKPSRDEHAARKSAQAQAHNGASKDRSQTRSK